MITNKKTGLGLFFLLFISIHSYGQGIELKTNAIYIEKEDSSYCGYIFFKDSVVAYIHCRSSIVNLTESIINSLQRDAMNKWAGWAYAWGKYEIDSLNNIRMKFVERVNIVGWSIDENTGKVVNDSVFIIKEKYRPKSSYRKRIDEKYVLFEQLKYLSSVHWIDYNRKWKRRLNRYEYSR